MAVTFPDHPDLIGGYAPLQIESDTASLLEVIIIRLAVMA